MARTRVEYLCTGCGYKAIRWQGRCPQCGAWDSLQEVAPAASAGGGARPAAPAGSTHRLDALAAEETPRRRTDIGELDRVLGGGLVPGSVVLVGGEPGVGKSTLLLQAADALAASGAGVIYVSAEESPRQIALRARRLGLRSAVEVSADAELGTIASLAESRGPDVLIVDSMQTIRSAELEASAGSLAQVRAAAALLADLARRGGICVLLVGHVTKDGQLAGPKATEHLVDCVLMFEGDPAGSRKILRATKNRFGSTNEVGLFEMGDRGLEPVVDPSGWFVAERDEPVSGTAVCCVLEGTRPLPVEVEALVAASPFAAPRRIASGIDVSRLHLVLAVLEQRCGLRLGQSDVYVNVPGGLRVAEPAMDLAVALAVASSLGGVALPPRCAVLGEVGLTGELRAVGSTPRRLEQLAQLGYEVCVLPVAGWHSTAPAGLTVRPARTLREAMSWVSQPNRPADPELCETHEYQ